MAATMRAAQLVGPGRALELTEVPRPVASPGEALVRVAACGFCHTDLHYLDHGVLTAKPPPVTLGHEISGTVEAVGTPLEEDRIGQRVLVPAVLPCGRCGFCRSGRENICPDLRMLGNHLDGGFAEFVRVPVRDLVPLPPEIDLERGAVIADALTTPYHAVVHRARVRSGEWVAVVGCGGVGINAVQFAAAAGANVLAVDLRAERLETARRLGAVETVDPAGVEDLGREVRRRTGGGVDVALEAVGTPKTVLAALSTLRRGGRLCVLGYSDLTVALPLNRLMFFEYEIVGSLGRVQVDPVVTMRRPLAEVNAAADDLRQGRGLRTIIVP